MFTCIMLKNSGKLVGVGGTTVNVQKSQDTYTTHQVVFIVSHNESV